MRTPATATKIQGSRASTPESVPGMARTLCILLAACAASCGGGGPTVKNVVLVSNLSPRKMRGVESQGMVLAATSADGNVVVVTLDRDAAPGSKVS